MELTYHDIMKADFSALTTAADEWRAMAKGCGTVRNNYRDHVRAKLKGWVGEASSAFWVSSATTLHELSAAQTQAKKVAELLDDAHERLVEARNHLKSVRDSAVEDGHMKVDEYGKCTTDTSRSVLRKGEDGPGVSAPVRMQNEAKWNRRIQKAVQHVNDADYDNMLALKAAAKDTDGKGDTNGFNSKAVGDVEKYAAKRAASLALKLDAQKVGGGLSAKERHELQVHMRSNANDPEFSRPFLKSIGGAEGTVKIANALNMLKIEERGVSDAQYRSMEKGLATSVATGVTVPPFLDKNRNKLALGSKEYTEKYKKWLKGDSSSFYREWRKDMQRLGPKEWDEKYKSLPSGPSHPQATGRGYQTLVTLLEHGEDYSAQMLHDLGDDIQAAEMKDSNLWDDAGRFPRKEFEGDPYDTLLGVMSKDPETAASYLDPATDTYTVNGENTEKNNRMEYLVKDRDWKFIDAPQSQAAKEDTVAKEGRAGFEDALRAGATGRVPGTEATMQTPNHSATNTHVMAEAVRVFGYAPGDEVAPIAKGQDFVKMRPVLGEMIAEYPGDVQRYAYGDDKLPVFGHRADFNASALHGFLGEVARDPSAYGVISASQQQYTANHLQNVVNDFPQDIDPADARNKVGDAVAGGAYFTGVLSEAKADSLYEDKVAQAQDFNDKAEESNKWVNRFVGLGTLGLGKVEGGDIAGTPVGWIQEDANDAIVENIKQDIPAEADNAEEEGRYRYLRTRARLGDFIGEWSDNSAREAGFDANKDLTEQIQAGARNRALTAFGDGSGAERSHGSVAPEN